MFRLAFLVIATLASIANASAQQFELADVHAIPTASAAVMRGGFLRGDRYELRAATMVDLIRLAYAVDSDKVIGGPAWLDTSRFDLIAKTPADTSPEALRSMLQALLAERFHLIAHLDTKPFPEYTLKSGPHPRLKEPAGARESGCMAAPPNAQTATYSCHNITMAEFASRLPRMAGNYFQLTPVVDFTGLQGAWDFTLSWTPRNLLAAAGANSITIYDAVDKQLGLKLDVQQTPMPVVRVDSVNEKPASNPADVSRALQAIQDRFEVAVIKPASPGAKESFRVEPGGKIDLRGISLRKLIKYAWDLQDTDVKDNDELLAAGPRWLASERFDIVARPALSESASSRAPVDFNALRLMLQALLQERFKLVVHTEQRPVSVYALIAAKPNLKRADSSNRSGCRNVPALPERSGAPGPIFSLRCQNMTMPGLSERLQPIGGIYVPHPVIDSTGLEGAWDFVLSWSPPHILQGCGGCASDAGLAAAAENTTADSFGSLSIVEALDRQLGLKLRLEKHSMPVLVIDRIEQSPSDN
ncbi:MAG TPA: TIGR03435 family protein [Bryobacteraceae bacterium]|jgi:uncharacterized protein (TIGR03435 family)|nr:TIGR03435 family protein [Bryobacteraceae bacterium]